MEPSVARAGDWDRLSAAVPLVLVARRFQWRTETAVVGDLRSRRAARCRRMVDGCLRAFGAGRGFPISSRDASYAGALDLCRHRLDVASARRGRAFDGAVTSENRRGR